MIETFADGPSEYWKRSCVGSRSRGSHGHLLSSQTLLIKIQGPPGRRYVEPSNLKIHSGLELGQDPAADNLVGEIEGALGVDVAELSLGQRLTAVSGGDEPATPGGSSESESEQDGFLRRPNGKPSKSKSTAPDSVPASSLTRTLIQALHSSDSRLLETCLGHSDPLLIRSTVRKLPPQLAVPLLTACVDRLGRGHRAANMKGGGGGASSQRGISLIAWVKVVLIVHSGHLMTVRPCSIPVVQTLTIFLRCLI